MLIATGLHKRYGDTVALDGFDLRVGPGEIVGLVGHNGAGKTTFIEIVTGLVRPDAGRVLVGGIEMARRPRAARALIGYAPQDIGLYLSQTVRENLRLFAGLAGLRGRTQARRIADIAEALGLSGELDRRVGLLSGGQRRRTQAATALMSKPRLLLLDEPTTGADPGTRQALLGVVRRLADRGTAICYTTHYLPELADLAATIAVASNGRIIARGSQRELLAGIPAELRVRFADGTVQSMRSADPSAELGRLLSAGKSVQDVDIRRPSLDDLYHSLESDHARPAVGTRQSHPVSA